MPIYSYKCACGQRFDRYLKLEKFNEPQTCACGNVANKQIVAPFIAPDYAGYVSPATGEWVEGKRARIEDLKKSNCRPYEEGEREEFIKRTAQREAENDRQLDRLVEQTYQEISH